MPQDPEAPRRRIVTGDDVRSLPEGSLLELEGGAIVTDVAREWIERNKIRIESRKPAKRQPVRIALGSDHAGFEMKEDLKSFLDEVGASFLDFGTHSKAAVDYPDFAHRVAIAVALGEARQGIMVDGAGIGSAIVANKVPGIRAAACHDEAQARNAREHNDANLLALGSRVIPLEMLRKVVSVFLTAELTEPRHRARVSKIEALEQKYYRPV